MENITDKENTDNQLSNIKETVVEINVLEELKDKNHNISDGLKNKFEHVSDELKNKFEHVSDELRNNFENISDELSASDNYKLHSDFRRNNVLNARSDEDSPENHSTSSASRNHNNWSEKNTKTVKKWKDKVAQISFVSQAVLEKYKKILSRYQIASLIISSIAALLSTSSLSIEENRYPRISLTLKIILAFLTTSSAISSGIVKIFKYDEIVENLAKYIESIDNFYGAVSSALILNSKLREDAIEFIKRENKNFQTLMMNGPNIDPSDYEMAMSKYQKSFENPKYYRQKQKYGNTTDEMDIV
tara:strand:- start:14722 stop:15630 length:909 start_codon:yes stop_codon:yes gene_type:complete